MRRVLFSCFWQHETLRRALQQRILPRGYGALATAMVSAVMCLGNPSMTLLQGLATVLCLIALSTLHALTRRATIRVQRHGPSQVIAGQIWQQYLVIEGTGTLQGYRLLDLSPDSRPSFLTFSQRREPLENQRNGFDRFMAFYRWQWLLQQQQAFAPQHSDWQQHLTKNSTHHLPQPLRPQQRGLLILSELRVQLPDVFFLFQRSCRVRTNAFSLLVLPRRFRVSNTCFQGDARGRHADTRTPNVPHLQGDMRGLRPYQRGDSPRQIHWRATARSGKFISKEMEEPQRDQWGLVLDTCAPATTELFEAAVSVCASLLHAAEQHQRPLAWLHFTHETFSHPTPRTRNAAHGQRRLAEVQPHANACDVHPAIIPLPSCVLVTCQWPLSGPQLQGLVNDENSRILYIGENPPPPLPRHAQWLHPQRLEHDLLRLRL